MKEWLDKAVFYEIYPQSFQDSNSDGTGDLQGIITRLDYIEALGCNALWINPCFDSPFVDAGYDITDYCRIAPRYGTNADMKQLCDELHKRDMHILLDLVPGHTSIESKWYKESAKADRNEYTDRYVWNSNVWEGFEGTGSIMGWNRGGTERDAACAVNFFNAQPALNYGFAKPDPDKTWQQAATAEGPMATRKAILDVICFWLGVGCDGFRVDMAGSLVKSDENQEATIELWQQMFAEVHSKYPGATFVSEWGDPGRSLKAGFDMDFLLHFGPSHYPDLFRTEHPFFAEDGGGTTQRFFSVYMQNKEKTEKGNGLMCLPSGNHDMDRMARTLDATEQKLAFAFILSMPGAPFIYYGDELGMKYVEGLKSVEGGYDRTGSRSPMAWDNSANYGFSAAPASDLYIRQDESSETLNVRCEEMDPDSTLNIVKQLIKIRGEHPALAAHASFELLTKDGGYPLVYRRSCADETLYILINPSDTERTTAAATVSGLPETPECVWSYTMATAEAGATTSITSAQPCKTSFELTRQTDGSVTVPPCSALFMK